MESIKNKKNASNTNIIVLVNCRSSDSESEKNKYNIKLNRSSSFDSENYQDSSLEVSNFSNNKLVSKSMKLSPIPENINDEQSSNMDRNEISPKMNFTELMKFPQQIGEKTTNNVLSNVILSPIILCKNKSNNCIKVPSLTDKKNEFNETKNNINGCNELEVDDVNKIFICNQCVCTSSLCQIF